MLTQRKYSGRGKVLQVTSQGMTPKTQLHGCKTSEYYMGFALVGTCNPTPPTLLFCERLQVLITILVVILQDTAINSCAHHRLLCRPFL